MMEPEELYSLLTTSGLEVAYREWGYAKPPHLPYVVFYEASRNDFGADDIGYLKRSRWVVELYSENKDIDSERLIEALFSWYYTKNEIGKTDASGAFMTAWYFTR